MRGQPATHNGDQTQCVLLILPGVDDAGNIGLRMDVVGFFRSALVSNFADFVQDFQNFPGDRVIAEDIDLSR